MKGLMLVNKARGGTSFDLIRQARRQLQIKKIGHAGTLDPFAQGLMILALGEATKALNYLLKHDKHYTVQIELGKISDTYDSEGKITAKNLDRSVKKNELEQALSGFLGKIKQVPPKYSAIKIGGKRACDRVRAGEEIEIPAKEVELFGFEILKFDYPQTTISLHCSSGFYVRSLAHNLGEKLGVGAYATELIRTKIGNFDLASACAPEEISADKITPLKPENFPFPSVKINTAELAEIRHGRQISTTAQGLVSIFHDNDLVAFAEGKNGLLQIKRGVF